MPGEIVAVQAPGRVNLIGEHTDYNEGFVAAVAALAAVDDPVAPGRHAGDARRGALWPVHRSARLTKVLASVETATGLFINDTLPEHGAAALRAVGVPAREEVEAVRVGPIEPGT